MDVSSRLVVITALAFRLHQWLPRHGQCDGDVHRHRALKPRSGGDSAVQLVGAFILDRGGQDDPADRRRREVTPGYLRRSGRRICGIFVTWLLGCRRPRRTALFGG